MECTVYVHDENNKMKSFTILLHSIFYCKDYYLSNY